MKAGLQEFIRRFVRPIDKNLKDQLYVFAICIGISIFFWLLIKLSKEHTTTIPLSVKFEQIPQDKLLINNPDPHIYIDIDATGSDLIGMKFFKRRPRITIDVNEQPFIRSGNTSRVRIPTNQILDMNLLRNEFHEKLINVSPDTLILEFEDLHSKKVPVQADLKYELKQQHFLSDKVLLTPDSIVITGRKNQVMSVDYVKTRFLEYKELSNKIDREVDLLIPEDWDNMKVSDNRVHLEIPVQKFTEIEKKISIQISNVPKTYSVKMFPEDVQVVYRVAIEEYELITEEMFHVSVDYNDVLESNSRILKVNLLNHPDQVEIVSMNPSQIEYIIVKEND